MIGLTGANGELGRRIARALAAAGTAELVLGTRNGVCEHAPDGARVRAVDFSDPAGTRRAFEGVDELLLISTGADVEEGIRQHRTAIDAAVDAGVRRIVYTSFIDCAADSPFPTAHVHAATEAALAEAGASSGVEYLILRDGQYMDRFVEFAPGAAASGELSLPIAPEAGASFICRDDLAEFAARALLTSSLTGVLTPTGSRVVSYAEATAAMSAATGAEIRFTPCDADDYRRELQDAGWPAWKADSYTRFFEAVGEGRTSAVTGDFAALMGREPRGVEEFVAAGLS